MDTGNKKSFKVKIGTLITLFWIGVSQDRARMENITINCSIPFSNENLMFGNDNCSKPPFDNWFPVVLSFQERVSFHFYMPILTKPVSFCHFYRLGDLG